MSPIKYCIAASSIHAYILLPPFLFICRWIVQFYTIQRQIKRNGGRIYISEWRTIITCKLLRTPGVRYVDGPTPQCRLMKLQLPGRAVDGVWRKSGAGLGPVVSACTAFVGQKTESGAGRQAEHIRLTCSCSGSGAWGGCGKGHELPPPPFFFFGCSGRGKEGRPAKKARQRRQYYHCHSTGS
jgi:hypothetical protein